VRVPFKVIIPARYASTRLPGKPLLEIGGRSLLEHVYHIASASGADEVIIATDDIRIEQHARAFGATVVMTSIEHQSGTDRINEALTKLNCAADTIIVNLQGDEYGLQSGLIQCVADALHCHPACQMATLCVRITDPQAYNDPNTVKVVFDNSNTALYFSRSPIPWGKQDIATADKPLVPAAYKHIGIYAYRAAFLKIFAGLTPSRLEQQESLEQLRALSHGYSIHVEEVAQKSGIEINTEEDLQRARATVSTGR